MSELCDCGPSPHQEGTRNCILCECVNCEANAGRSLFELLPCVGWVPGLSDGPAVQD